MSCAQFSCSMNIKQMLESYFLGSPFGTLGHGRHPLHIEAAQKQTVQWLSHTHTHRFINAHWGV